MRDVLRIYVLWAPRSAVSGKVAELISKHFDGIGMERDGVSHRVPVRYRSVAWDAGSIQPRPIDLEGADHNAIVLLHSGDMQRQDAEWSKYVGDLNRRIAARGNVDVYIPFGALTPQGSLTCDEGKIQYARRDRWQALPDQAKDTRFLLHLVFKLREHIRKVTNRDEKEPLFVSHAKADGDTTARAIVDYIKSTSNDLLLDTFYDAKELSPGENFGNRFEDEIKRGTLLAIVSDIYDSRPWCVYELTTAKRHQRPIVLADVGGLRTSRTYPYGANLPRVRVKRATDDAKPAPGEDKPAPEDTTWIEPLLVETLSEALRCDLFGMQASKRADSAGIAAPRLILPRPPELLDIVERLQPKGTVIYPDPPLGRIESEILMKAMQAVAPDARLRTLGEI